MTSGYTPPIYVTGYLDKLMFHNIETNFVVLQAILHKTNGISSTHKVMGELPQVPLLGMEWKWTFGGQWGVDKKQPGGPLAFKFRLAEVVPQPLTRRTLLVCASKNAGVERAITALVQRHPEYTTAEDLLRLLSKHSNTDVYKWLMDTPYFVALLKKLRFFSAAEVARLPSEKLTALIADVNADPLKYGFRGAHLKICIGPPLTEAPHYASTEDAPVTSDTHYVHLKPRKIEHYEKDAPGYLNKIYSAKQALWLMRGVQLLEEDGHMAYALMQNRTAPSVIERVLRVHPMAFSKEELQDTRLLMAATELCRRYGELVEAVGPTSMLLTSTHHQSVRRKVNAALQCIFNNAKQELLQNASGSKEHGVKAPRYDPDEMAELFGSDDEDAHPIEKKYSSEIEALFVDDENKDAHPTEKKYSPEIEALFVDDEEEKKEKASLAGDKNKVQLKELYESRCAVVRQYVEGYPGCLSEEQRAALFNMLTAPISEVAGRAGTGKTTILKAFVDIAGQDTVMGITLTNAAAEVMRDKGGVSHVLNVAQVIHCPWPAWMRNIKYVVLEEASLLSMEDVARLLNTLTVPISTPQPKPLVRKRKRGEQIETVKTKTITREVVPKIAHLTVMGDANQIPSIGPGDFIRDIRLAQYPTTQLTKIFRTESRGIMRVCQAALNKNPKDIVECEDVTIDDLEIPRGEKELPILISALMRAIPLFAPSTGYDPMHTRVVSTLHVTVDAANKALLGLQFADMTGTAPLSLIRVGQRVVFQRNEADKGYINGQESVVLSIEKLVHGATVALQLDELDVRGRLDKGASYLLVCSGRSADKPIRISITPEMDTGLLAPANSRTIMVSQGSEFPVVIPIIRYKCPIMTWRKLYSALSRARNKLHIIMTKGALNTIKDDVERCTAVVENLPKYSQWTDMVGIKTAEIAVPIIHAPPVATIPSMTISDAELEELCTINEQNYAEQYDIAREMYGSEVDS